jgi:hypothetical protein
MKIKLSDLRVQSCFIDKKGEMKKKIGDRKVATVKSDGRVKTRKVTGNPDVEETPCSIRLFGVGLRRHPDMIVEVGDGDLLKKRNNR